MCLFLEFLNRPFIYPFDLLKYILYPSEIKINTLIDKNFKGGLLHQDTDLYFLRSSLLVLVTLSIKFYGISYESRSKL